MWPGWFMALIIYLELTSSSRVKKKYESNYVSSSCEFFDPVLIIHYVLCISELIKSRDRKNQALIKFIITDTIS